MNTSNGTPASRGTLHAVGAGLVITALGATVWLGANRARARADEGRARDAVAAEGTHVLITAVKPTPAGRVVRLQGDVRAIRQATLYAKVSGYLETLKVDRGDAVKADQVLGTIQSPETAQQEISARADLLLRERTEKRVRTLLPSGVVSQQEMDNATGGLDVSKAEAARIHALRDYEVLRAPFAGRVTARYVDPGALLSAATGATQSAQPVLDVADLSRVRIFVYPGQLDAAHIKEGDKVTFWTDDDPGHKREAPVVRTTHSLEPRTRTMLVEVDADNADESVHPGSFVHVELSIPAGAALLMPADAIVIRGGKPQAATVKDGHVHYVPVDVTDDDGVSVWIGSGVHAGDDVVLHPSDDVLEGAPVLATRRPEK